MAKLQLTLAAGGYDMVAFEKAKKWAYRRIENPRMVPLAFVRSTVEESRR